MARYELGDLIWRITGDTTNFDRNIGAADARIGKLSGSLQKVGANLTKFVTLPLLGIGTASVKAASDLGESINAVNVVFEGSAGIINDWGKTAAEQAGLSQSAFNGLATFTGALLKQTGQDLDTVANNTINLTKRAADLASVFNTEVDDALGALNAALRGESEPARRFAINISDAAVQAEALASGLVKSASEITEQIKVQARFNIIMKQSADAAGDFENTSGELANKTRILKAQIVDVAAELGTAFLPIVQDVVSGIADAVKWFSELDDGTKKLIVTIGVIAAATGPVLSAVGTILKLRDAIIAMNTTALLGPLGAIAAIAALAVGVGALIGQNNELKAQRMEEEFKDIAAAAGLTGEQLQRISQEFTIFNVQGTGSARNILTIARELGREFGKTPAQILEIAERYDELGSDARSAIQTVLEQQRVEQDLIASVTRYEQLRAQEKEAIEARARAQAEQAEREAAAIANALQLEKERVQSVVDRREAALKQTEATVDEINRKMAAGFITQEEGAKAVTRALEEEANELFNIGFTGQLVATTWITKAGERVTAIAAGDRRLNEILKTLQAERLNDALAANEQERRDFADTASFMTETQRAAAQVRADIARKELDAELAAIDEVARRRKEEEEARIASAWTVTSAVIQGLDILEIASNAKLKRDLAALDAQLQAQLEAEGVAEKTKLQRLDDEIAALEDKLKTETNAEARARINQELEEAKSAKRRTEIEEEFQQKRAKLEYEAALNAWRLNLIQATAETAVAIIKPLAQLGVFGIPDSIAAGITGGIQIATVSAARPKPPAFARGGEFLTSGPQLIQVGDNPGGVERVSITPESSPNFDGPGRSPMVARVYLDGRQIAEAVFEQMDSGNVRIPR